eukprot:15448417-Alexandrium_andersonii.AAC.1
MSVGQLDSEVLAKILELGPSSKDAPRVRAPHGAEPRAGQDSMQRCRGDVHSPARPGQNEVCVESDVVRHDHIALKQQARD